MLTLPIKSKWFNMIKSKIKKEEYRNITHYYTTRFNNAKNENNQFSCILRNGYSVDSPSIEVFVEINKGYGREEWGAEPSTLYYVLSILDIKE